MDTVNGLPGYDAHIDCPLCVRDGLTTSSGYTPPLTYHPWHKPSFLCSGVHGFIPDETLRAFGVDPSPPADVVPSHEPSYGDDPRRGRT